MKNAYAIILAGGNGERFWPLSTPERPKQFLSLFEGKALIRHAVDRLEGLFPPERIFVITANRFIAQTHAVLPMLPIENIIGEPCRRDTAAAVATACGLVLRRGGEEAVGCILTADHLIGPTDVFQQAIQDSVAMASASRAIVTMGIPPTRPETGFGYIHARQKVETQTKTPFRSVERFVEKPNEAVAREYLAAGDYLWNAGMFIWRADVMREAFRSVAADLACVTDALAGTDDVAETVARLYPSLRSISIDFAVMEKISGILVAESQFRWDDVGSWAAVENHFSKTVDGNTILGEVSLHNARSSIVVNASKESGRRVIVAGVQDLVVVETENATLVCAKSELKNMRAFVQGR